MQVFTFQVDATDKACGESNILLNGQKLNSHWDGTKAQGSDFLDLGNAARWEINCLYNSVPVDGSNSKGDDVVHVLSFHFLHPISTQDAGFTISYRQLGQPAIIRFRPRETTIGSVQFSEKLWRTPSLEFDLDVFRSAREKDLTHILSPTQKSLGFRLQALKSSLKAKLKVVIEHLPCHKQFSSHKPIESPVGPPPASPDRLLEPPPNVPDELSSSTHEIAGSTTTTPNLSAAETRSLKSPQALDPTSTLSPHGHSFRSAYNLQLIKIFGLVLILSSCVAWLSLRCRDPRRRADCLARREERRNRRLYKKAARHHAFKKWFWSFRVRYGLAPSAALSWDEKRAQVVEQENVLENVMADDIRALRNAHRVVSSITAAEEGIIYEVAGSERRRSISTLPGYETDGSQPPSYDGDTDDGLERADVVNGFRYPPAETEYSSVISTSPRISRDGTNSDFDEKFEPISLAK